MGTDIISICTETCNEDTVRYEPVIKLVLLHQLNFFSRYFTDISILASQES